MKRIAGQYRALCRPYPLMLGENLTIEEARRRARAALAGRVKPPAGAVVERVEIIDQGAPYKSGAGIVVEVF